MTANVEIRMTMWTGGFSIRPEQGDLIYLLCRGMRATRVVEFATSVGMSTLYFAAAMRDDGGGCVIGSELVPAKVATEKRNLSEAGLAASAEIREGDARETLRDLGVSLDFALIDGWPRDEEPSLAREVIQIVTPQLRVGGYVMNDNAELDFLKCIRDPGKRVYFGGAAAQEWNRAFGQSGVIRRSAHGTA
jgi:predicted O-methyltransferase YrrM